MQVIKNYDQHTDKRRAIIAWDEPFGQILIKEVKELIVTEDGARLGFHSHDYPEFFVLASGACTVQTWSIQNGLAETYCEAPCFLALAPEEEHVFTCKASTILIGFLPKRFTGANMIPSEHLPL